MEKAKKGTDWLTSHILKKYGDNSTKEQPSKQKNRPALKANPHQPTIELINKILYRTDCPDNIKVDTLRLLSLVLEADKTDNYTLKEFMKFLKRDQIAKQKKKQVQVQKATGGWVIK